MTLLIWITTLLVASAAGLLGSFMISKRMTLTAGPLGHLALPGVAIALFYDFNVFLGALCFILFGAVIVWVLKRVSNLPIEALTGIAFVFGLSLGLLLLPMEHAEEAIMGDVTKIEMVDFWIALTFSIIVFVIVAKTYKKIIMVTLSEDLAKTLEVNVKTLDLIFLILVALVVAMEVKIVGGIMTVALVILPASIASNVARSLKQYLLASPLSGIISASLGLLLYEYTYLPAGPLIVLSLFVFFLISIYLRKLVNG